MIHIDDQYAWGLDESLHFRKLVFTYETDFQTEKDKYRGWNGKNKRCSKCKKTLPANTYFFISAGTSGLHAQCKKCNSTSYGWGRNYNNKLNDEGQHYCSKCDRILPLNIFYFNPTNGRLNKTGFASNCKECTSPEQGFSLYSINKHKDLLNIKNDFKVCHKCLVELPDTDNYFFKRSHREHGMTICKKCKG